MSGKLTGDSFTAISALLMDTSYYRHTVALNISLQTSPGGEDVQARFPCGFMSASLFLSV